MLWSIQKIKGTRGYKVKSKKLKLKIKNSKYSEFYKNVWLDYVSFQNKKKQNELELV